MKYLMLVLLLCFQTVHARGKDNPTCDELSKSETKRMTKMASNYFWQKIAKKIADDPNITMVFDSFEGAEYSDCHDYDDEFDHMEFNISWKQKLKNGTIQKCTELVSVSYLDEVEGADRECENQ